MPRNVVIIRLEGGKRWTGSEKKKVKTKTRELWLTKLSKRRNNRHFSLLEPNKTGRSGRTKMSLLFLHSQNVMTNSWNNSSGLGPKCHQHLKEKELILKKRQGMEIILVYYAKTQNHDMVKCDTKKNYHNYTERVKCCIIWSSNIYNKQWYHHCRYTMM